MSNIDWITWEEHKAKRDSDPRKAALMSDARRWLDDLKASGLLAEFCKAKPLPNTVEVPLTLWERIKTYLPWSWSRNHKTKWVYNGPPTIKFNRRSPFQ